MHLLYYSRCTQVTTPLTTPSIRPTSTDTYRLTRRPGQPSSNFVLSHSPSVRDNPPELTTRATKSSFLRLAPHLQREVNKDGVEWSDVNCHDMNGRRQIDRTCHLARFPLDCPPFSNTVGTIPLPISAFIFRLCKSVHLSRCKLGPHLAQIAAQLK